MAAAVEFSEFRSSAAEFDDLFDVSAEDVAALSLLYLASSESEQIQMGDFEANGIDFHHHRFEHQFDDSSEGYTQEYSSDYFHDHDSHDNPGFHGNLGNPGNYRDPHDIYAQLAVEYFAHLDEVSEPMGLGFCSGLSFPFSEEQLICSSVPTSSFQESMRVEVQPLNHILPETTANLHSHGNCVTRKCPCCSQGVLPSALKRSSSSPALVHAKVVKAKQHLSQSRSKLIKQLSKKIRKGLVRLDVSNPCPVSASPFIASLDLPVHPSNLPQSPSITLKPQAPLLLAPVLPHVSLLATATASASLPAKPATISPRLPQKPKVICKVKLETNIEKWRKRRDVLEKFAKVSIYL